MPANSVQTHTLNRIRSLDGLRGLAILLVLLFHTYARWPEFIPWATTHADFYLFKLGFLGVELFFLISGFVIFMTLEKCHSFPEFMLRRWMRLFPAMLLASILVYLSALFLTDRPRGDLQPYDLLPGLLFLDHNLLNKLQNIAELRPIEGAFWSLFVEVKFYLIFGGLYFYNKRHALNYLIAIFLLAFAYEAAGKFSAALQFRPVTTLLFDVLSLKYFGWFCVGALLYKAHALKSKRMVLASMLLMLPTVMIMYGRGTTIVVACALVYGIFYLALNSQVFASFFATRALVFLGFISYPLYLIHENAMVALTIKTKQNWTWVPDLLTPWPGIALLALIAYLIAKHVEPRLQGLFRKVFDIWRVQHQPAQ